MKFDELLSVERIAVSKKRQTKERLLEDMVGLFIECKAVSEQDKILPDILQRESIISTGIGGGVAVPHIRKAYIQGVQSAFAINKVPVEYGSMDGEPVTFSIMILANSEDHEAYLRAVAKFAGLLHDSEAKEKLLKAESADEVMTVLLHFEKTH